MLSWGQILCVIDIITRQGQRYNSWDVVHLLNIEQTPPFVKNSLARHLFYAKIVMFVGSKMADSGGVVSL